MVDAVDSDEALDRLSGAEEGDDKGDVKGDISRAERNKQIIEYKLQGYTIYDIAEQFDLTPSRVAQICRQEFSREEFTIQHHRNLELRRLDRMTMALHSNVEAGNVFAIQSSLAVQVRRSRLLGLDRPTKIEVDDGPNRSGIRESIEAKLRALGEEYRATQAKTIDGEVVHDTLAQIERPSGTVEQAETPAVLHEPEPINHFLVEDLYGEAGIFTS